MNLFRVQDSGFRVQDSGFRVQGSGFRVQGSGFRVQGSGFEVPHRGVVLRRLLSLSLSLFKYLECAAVPSRARI